MKYFALCLVAAVVGVASAYPGAGVAYDSSRTITPVGDCPLTDGDEPVYLADSFHPSVYYVCRQGMPIRTMCLSGVFDAGSGACVDIDTYSPVGKCPEKDGKYPTFLPDSHRKDVYYVCSWGTPIRMKCEDGLIFKPGPNITDNVCVHP